MIDTGAAPQAAAALPGRVAVLIVGAGFGGLGCAIALAADGEQDFLCLDRGSEVGGTWRDNTYPGATCDVPSQLYSFSFALNPGWSRSFSSQPEIQDYLRTVAASSGVLDRFRFGVEFLGARWDAEQALWLIETSAGPVVATLLVSAAGALSEPKLPDLPGLADFADFGGAVFHSARWDHRQQLAGRRVAVIGTGASAGATVPGFPNLFFLVGPNTTLGHSSMICMIESQVAYLVDAWRRMRQHRLAAVEVDAAAEQAWNCDVQRRMRRTVWSTGCRSWYLDADGRNVALWPRTSYAFRRFTARFDLPAYRTYRTTPVDGASAGG